MANVPPPAKYVTFARKLIILSWFVAQNAKLDLNQIYVYKKDLTFTHNVTVYTMQFRIVLIGRSFVCTLYVWPEIKKGGLLWIHSQRVWRSCIRYIMVPYYNLVKTLEWMKLTKQLT